MKLDSLHDLHMFVQVIDSEGFTDAARVLGATTNAVSRSVARLEQSLGLRLMVRTTRHVSATEEGRRLYEHAVPLLQAAEAAEQAAMRAAQLLDGTVRIAVRTITVQHGIVTDLTHLLRDNPELRVQLVVTDAYTDLAASGIDVALVVGEQADSSYRSVSLGHVSFVPAAAPSYFADLPRPESPGELVGHECIRTLSSRPQVSWHLIGPEGQKVDAAITGRFECNDVRAQSDAIYGGLGIGLRPLGEVEKAEAEGRLLRVLPGWSLAPLPVYALLSPQRTQSGRVQAVLALLRAAVSRLNGK